MVVISDICFCEYTTHGHCDIVNTPAGEEYNAYLETGYLLNDVTRKLLSKACVVHAQAGADIIAPSGMLDIWSARFVVRSTSRGRNTSPL